MVAALVLSSLPGTHGAVPQALVPQHRAHHTPNLAANSSEAEPKINPLPATTTLPLSCLEILTAVRVT